MIFLELNKMECRQRLYVFVALKEITLLKSTFVSPTEDLRGRRNLPDVIYFLLHLASLVLSDAVLDCHQYSQVLELVQSLQFY